MENMNQPDTIFNLTFDATAKNHLRSISQWAKIYALSSIATYIVSILLVFMKGGSAGSGNDTNGVFVSSSSYAGTVVGTFITVIIGVILNLLLYKFALGVKEGVDGLKQDKLNSGFASFRSYFKMMGILAIILLSLVLLGVLLALMFSAGR